MAVALPLALMAAGTIFQGVQKSNADKYNSQVMGNEQKLSVDQANQQEGQVRRSTREAHARQLAAFGGAGVGYGGSSETAINESSVNQELDALNSRYKGAITGYGYGVQSKILKNQASDDISSSFLMAGGRALDQYGKYQGA